MDNPKARIQFFFEYFLRSRLPDVLIEVTEAPFSGFKVYFTCKQSAQITQVRRELENFFSMFSAEDVDYDGDEESLFYLVIKESSPFLNKIPPVPKNCLADLLSEAVEAEEKG